jgi:hypothetical protein
MSVELVFVEGMSLAGLIYGGVIQSLNVQISP